jgi:hypothetical protein
MPHTHKKIIFQKRNKVESQFHSDFPGFERNKISFVSRFFVIVNEGRLSMKQHFSS